LAGILAGTYPLISQVYSWPIRSRGWHGTPGFLIGLTNSFPQLVKLGFKFDNVLMEEAAQILEIETFIPLMCQACPNGIYLVSAGCCN
jgi:hypothetical protein